MGDKIYNTRIKHKRDTSANWTSSDPVLLDGEIIIVDTDNGVRTKTGDGKKKYTQLPFDDELINSKIDQKLDKSGGTMTGDIDMNAHKISGINIPTEDSDAANKLYADTRVILDTYTVTLSSSNWAGSAAPYSQTITVNGVLATDTPYIAPVFSSANSTAALQQQAWNMVSKAESSDGAIIFTCFEKKPTTDIPLKIEVVRYGFTAVDGSEVSY